MKSKTAIIQQLALERCEETLTQRVDWSYRSSEVAIVDPGRLYEVGLLRRSAKSCGLAGARPKRPWKLWKTLRGLCVFHELPQPLLRHSHREAGTKGNARRKRKSSQIRCPRNHGYAELTTMLSAASPPC